MPLATAAIGAANAGASRGSEAILLPVDAGAPAERLALENLLVRARGSGVVGARLFGHVATPPPHAGDIAHACAALVAFAAAAAGLNAGVWLLSGIALSAALRAMGWPCLDTFLPKRPCWSLVLRPYTQKTRRIVVAATDRTRVAPRLPLVTLAAVAVALLGLAAGHTGWLVGIVGLLGVVAAASWLGRSARVEPEGPEAAAARRLFALAGRNDPTTAVVLSGCSSARGDGVVALLDWWGLRPEAVDIHFVQAEGAPVAAALSPVAAALARAGWRVRTFPPEGLPDAPADAPSAGLPVPDAPRSPP
ncbi:MAG: hypothetical protein V4850_00755 [Myxococcota bacterium]